MSPSRVRATVWAKPAAILTTCCNSSADTSSGSHCILSLPAPSARVTHSRSPSSTRKRHVGQPAGRFGAGMTACRRALGSLGRAAAHRVRGARSRRHQRCPGNRSHVSLAGPRPCHDGNDDWLKETQWEALETEVCFSGVCVAYPIHKLADEGGQQPGRVVVVSQFPLFPITPCVQRA
eukprot:3732984-Rhodomonas_salina.3